MKRRASRSYLATQPVEKRLLRLPCALRMRNIQTDRTGTKVLERRYDATIEKPTAKRQRHEQRVRRARHEEGGMNTARMQSMASNRGTVVSAVASQRGAGEALAIGEMGVDVLDRDRRFVDQDADGQRQAAERHDVDRLAR